jgi:predicted esterase
MRLSIIGVVIVFALFSANTEEKQRGRFTKTIAGYSKQIHIYVPNSYSDKNPAGLILGLHGSGGNGAGFLSAWNTGLLDKYGFIMVAPDSVTGAWAMGGDFEGQKREGEYIKAIIEDMKKNYKIDDEKIYVTGFSAGSAYLMVGIAALEHFRAFKIRGAALFSGGITGEMGVNPDKAKETTIRIYIGTGDTPHLGPAQNAADSFKKAGYNCELVKVPGAHNYPLTDHTKVLEWFVQLYEPVKKKREVEKELQEAEKALSEKKYKEAIKSYQSAKKKAEKEKELEALLKKAEDGLKAVEQAGVDALAEAEKLANEGKYSDAYKLLKKVQDDFKGTDIAKQAKDKENELKEKEKNKPEEKEESDK